MLLFRIWNFLRGYVMILAEGVFLEKFLNICIRRGILLWNIKKQKDGTLVACISINGFRLIRPIARKAKSRIRIIKKKGLPFLLNRYRHRKTFVLGAFIFVFLFYLLSSYIWVVEITGNHRIETQEILNCLAENGIKPGTVKYSINTDKAANSMMLDIDELAWIGIVVRGTKVKVEVVERVIPPDLVPKDEPCNIVANRDGVVKTIIAKKGLGAVKIGETVTKGQILISGTIIGKLPDTILQYVHSTGIVKARTWYENQIEVETKEIQKIRSGRIKKEYSIQLFSKKIDLFHKKNPFVDYEIAEIKEKLSVGENVAFPIEWIEYIYYEVEAVERIIDPKIAEKVAADMAYDKTIKEISPDAEIIKTSMGYKEDNKGKKVVVVTIECIEDIGIKQKIGGN